MGAVYRWSQEKNIKLMEERGISFEEVVLHLEQRQLLGIVHGKGKYGHQKQFLVEVGKYVYIVPFVEEGKDRYFLKTVIPSRKMTRDYLMGGD